MKSYKIVLFIFGTIALLGVLCAFFPADGLSVGGMTLEFPSLTEVLSGGREEAEAADDEVTETPEQMFERLAAEARNQEELRFLEFCNGNSARIYFPDGKVETFDSFFEALDSARIHPMRIVHYGDSQMEEDRITCVYRPMLQKQFGGNGVGMMPLIQYAMTLSVRQSHSGSALRSMVYGNKEFSTGGKYGMMGMASRISSPVSLTYYPSTKVTADNPSKYFTHFTVIADTLRAPLKISSGTAQAVLDTVRRPMRRYRVDLPDSTTNATLRISGSGDIYGVLLDGEDGVSVDNVAMRGCSGTVFTNINADQLRDFYEHENVRLIILQYGGNVMPYMTAGKAAQQYGEKIDRQIKYIKSLAPEACILFIGPSDMSTNINGSMQTYRSLPAVVDTLRNVANRNGAAYWDLYRVMGGKNSMAQWVKSGLAGPDYVHFTHKGAQKVGETLGNTLLFYHEYYQWRHTPASEQVDAVKIDSLMRKQCEADSIQF